MPMYLGAQSKNTLLLAPSSENALPSQSIKAGRRNRSAANVLRILGTVEMYNGYLPVRVLHRTNVETFTETGEVIIDDHQLSFLSKDIPFAKKGDVFNVGGKTLKLKTPLDRSKEGLQTWVAK